jgi:methylated-DNA-[protein]-cysteine S-methyltransferase
MENQDHLAYFKSPIGVIELTGSMDGISSLIFIDEEKTSELVDLPVLIEGMAQIEEYFLGKRKHFDLKLDIHGTEFQRKVWNKLMEIPYSQTISYLQLAKRIGNVKAIRAVGTANGRNPLSIIIPCHRVIGSNGDLTGYGGGLWRKEWLLKHESQSGTMNYELEFPPNS